MTNADGIAEFLTIYPGWYQGRTVHIHVKVHLDAATLVTSQLFFDDALSDMVYATEAPYTQHTGRTTTNADDGIFSADMVLTTSAQAEGYLGLITLNVQR